MPETDRTKQLASLLDGEHQVHYDHGIGRRGFIDVKVGRWVIEYDSPRKKAIEDAEKRVAHGWGDVLAVWPDSPGRMITGRSIIHWRSVSPSGEPDRRGSVAQLGNYLADR